MRKFLAKIGVTALFALALFTLSISQASAQKFKDKAEGPVTLEVDCDAGESIQASVDSAGEGDTINVSGTCTEIVTITTDGITIIGQGESATLMGGIIVDGAQRVVFDNLTIDGSTNTEPLDGVLVQNNAQVTVQNSTIKNHTGNGVSALDGGSVKVSNLTITNHARDGVSIERGSIATIDGSTITNNGRYGVIANAASTAWLTNNPLIQSDVTDGPRTLIDPFTATTIGAFNNSHMRLLGGNHIVNDGVGGGTAVEVFHSSSFRQQFSLGRIEGSRAISIGNGSTADLRGEFQVTGRVQLTENSTLRLRLRFGPNGVINGQIRVFNDSSVFFSLFTLKGAPAPVGPVTVNGTLVCGGNEGHVRLFSGQVPADIMPSPLDRANSQCNDFNGNVIFPAP